MRFPIKKKTVFLDTNQSTAQTINQSLFSRHHVHVGGLAEKGERELKDKHPASGTYADLLDAGGNKSRNTTKTHPKAPGGANHFKSRLLPNLD